MIRIDEIYENTFLPWVRKNLPTTSIFYCDPFGRSDPDSILCRGLENAADEQNAIFFFDQEPIQPSIHLPTFQSFNSRNAQKLEKNKFLVASETNSDNVDYICKAYGLQPFYYFFHGWAALDWYRGYYALNYNKSIVKQYNYDFISFNRIINNDRSYRIYFISLLKELELIEKGLVSFNVTDNLFDDWRDEVADPNTKLSEHARQHAEMHLVNVDKLVIDNPTLPGSASADIPRTVDAIWPNNSGPNYDAFWHIVTETVFYYDKLHLTEKIFK